MGFGEVLGMQAETKMNHAVKYCIRFPHMKYEEERQEAEAAGYPERFLMKIDLKKLLIDDRLLEHYMEQESDSCAANALASTYNALHASDTNLDKVFVPQTCEDMCKVYIKIAKSNLKQMKQNVSLSANAKQMKKAIRQLSDDDPVTWAVGNTMVQQAPTTLASQQTGLLRTRAVDW